MASSCVECGARLERGARYCSRCGARSTAAEETNGIALMPASFVLALAVAALAAAVVLAVVGSWPLALVLAGIAILLVAVFLVVARRAPVGANARARTTVAAESLAMRGRAARRLVAARRELRQLASQRNRLLFELGAAVYGGDEHAAETTRGRIEELDLLASRTEGEMHEIVEATQRRIDRNRLEVQQTEVAVSAVTPGTPQTPAPGEGNPPEPARIPEQYPPPDEGTPPQPAVIPEPGPAVIPEPGPQGAVREAG